MRHLPDNAAEISESQGWDSEALIIHLVGYIRESGLADGLAEYFAAVAREESTAED